MVILPLPNHDKDVVKEYALRSCAAAATLLSLDQEIEERMRGLAAVATKDSMVVPTQPDQLENIQPRNPKYSFIHIS